MKKKIIFLVLLSITCFKSNGQLKTELFENILKSRSDYVADSIPDKFKRYYKLFTPAGDILVSDTLNFYDMLIKNLPETFFHKENFLWFEYISDDFGRKYAILLMNDFIVQFNREYIARWDRKTPTEDSVIYKFKECDKFEKTLIHPFLKDFEEWNKNVTNRSYRYWEGAGGGFIFCSKVTFVEQKIEIIHTAFRYYHKDCPLLYIRERPEDNYQLRVQVNCDWITDEKRKEVVDFLMSYHAGHGNKVFDCNGKEIEFEYVLPEDGM